MPENLHLLCHNIGMRHYGRSDIPRHRAFLHNGFIVLGIDVDDGHFFVVKWVVAGGMGCKPQPPTNNR